MGFAYGMVEAVCDCCELETEPLDAGGSFDVAAKQLMSDGWIARYEGGDYELLCPDCQQDRMRAND